jgi:hypothetical protein
VSIDKLQFDEAAHRYTFDGRPVPSVTQILKPLSMAEYRGVDRATLDLAAWRGRAVHKMIELDLRDDLDVDALSDELQPYYTAWKNFQSLSGFTCHASEAQVYSVRHRYAGTLDLYGELNGKLVLVDCKRTAAVPRTAGPQTAAYLHAYAEHIAHDDPRHPVWTADRYALHLRADGSWRLVPFKDPADLRVFLSCLTIHQWGASE